MEETYIAGDRTSSIVRAAKGRVVRLEHDAAAPHPFDVYAAATWTAPCR
ncbi:hypothetical protein J7E88_06920 [Streptomyces sp. ISL-10]|nr:hypothetical protein [Streptomyces sp. ISL-10]